MIRSDAELVTAVLNGDASAFAALVERYERAARAVALRVLGDDDAAADAAQDALVIAYERLGSLRKRSAFGAWLMKIVKREAQRMSKTRRRTVPLESGREIARAHDNQALEPDATELLAAVERLPKHERTVVHLRYFQECSVEAVATITARPLGTVTKQLSRAHTRLRKWLNEEMER